MKNFIKPLLLALLIQSILMGQAFSSSRVDTLLEADRDELVTDLANKLNDFKNQRNDLQNFEQHLRLTRKGQSIYLKFESIAGGLIVVGLVIGSYKAHFPPGFRAMISAYVSVTGVSHGLIKLNDKDVQKLLNESEILNKKLNESESSLTMQLESQCKKIQYHQLCNS